MMYLYIFVGITYYTLYIIYIVKRGAQKRKRVEKSERERQMERYREN